MQKYLDSFIKNDIIYRVILMDLNDIVITEIKSVFTVPSPKGRHDKMVNRYCYGLSLCISGQITYTHNNKEFISDPHHAVILPKGQNYTIHGDKDGIFPVINFECAAPICDTIVTIPIDNVDSYIKEYEQIKSLILFNRSRAKTISIFYNILHKLASETTPSSNMLAPAIKYLEKNFFDSDITNTHLAKLCDISEVYFRKQFFEIYKTTPHQFVIDMRISKAKQLLTDGILKINAISEKCGFSNPYHFCRIFKQKTGLTPTEYVKENKIYKF